MHFFCSLNQLAVKLDVFKCHFSGVLGITFPSSQFLPWGDVILESASI